VPAEEQESRAPVAPLVRKREAGRRREGLAIGELDDDELDVDELDDDDFENELGV